MGVPGYVIGIALLVALTLVIVASVWHPRPDACVPGEVGGPCPDLWVTASSGEVVGTVMRRCSSNNDWLGGVGPGHCSPDPGIESRPVWDSTVGVGLYVRPSAVRAMT